MQSNKLKRFDRSDIMALVALLISLGAFSVSLIEANIMRDQQRLMQVQQKASVYPYLSKNISLNADGEATYKLSVYNKGVGPGKISAVEFRFQKMEFLKIGALRKAIEENFQEKIQSLAISSLDGYFISAGEEKSIVDIRLKKEYSILDLVSSLDLDVEVKYCSIYEDCWTTNDNSGDLLKGSKE